MRSYAPLPPLQARHHAWYHGPLSDVDPEAVERDVAAAAKAISKLGKVGLGGGAGSGQE